MEVMAKVSEYFQKMFYGDADFKEKKEKVVEIEDESVVDMITFLNCFEPDQKLNQIQGN